MEHNQLINNNQTIRKESLVNAIMYAKIHTLCNEYIYSIFLVVCSIQNLHYNHIGVYDTSFPFDSMQNILNYGTQSYFYSFNSFIILSIVISFLIILLITFQSLTLIKELNMIATKFVVSYILQIISFIFLTIFLLPNLSLFFNFLSCQDGSIIKEFCNNNGNFYAKIIFGFIIGVYLVYTLVMTYILSEISISSKFPWKLESENYRIVKLISRIIFHICFTLSYINAYIDSIFLLSQVFLFIYYLITIYPINSFVYMANIMDYSLIISFYCSDILDFWFGDNDFNIYMFLIVSLIIAIGAFFYNKYKMIIMLDRNPFQIKSISELTYYYCNIYTLLAGLKNIGVNRIEYLSLQRFLASHYLQCKNSNCICVSEDLQNKFPLLFKSNCLEKIFQIYGELIIQNINEMKYGNDSSFIKIFKIIIESKLKHSYFQAYFEATKSLRLSKSILLIQTLLRIRSKLIFKLQFHNNSQFRIPADNLYDFEKLKKKQFKLISTTSSLLKSFWEEFANINTKVENFQEIGSKVVNNYNELQALSIQLFKIAHEYYMGYYLYALFAKYVINNEDEYEYYTKHALNIEARVISTSTENNMSFHDIYRPDSNIGILVVSFEFESLGIIEFANDKFELLYGYSPPELENKNISKIMPKFIAVHHDHFLRNFFQTGNFNIIGNERLIFLQDHQGFIVLLILFIQPLKDISEGLKFIAFFRTIPKEIKTKFFKLPYELMNLELHSIVTNDNFVIEGISKGCLSIFGLPLTYLESKKVMFPDPVSVFRMFVDLDREKINSILQNSSYSNISLLFVSEYIDKDYLTQAEFQYFEKSEKQFPVYAILKEIIYQKVKKLYIFSFVDVRKDEKNLILANRKSSIRKSFYYDNPESKKTEPGKKEPEMINSDINPLMDKNHNLLIKQDSQNVEGNHLSNSEDQLALREIDNSILRQIKQFIKSQNISSFNLTLLATFMIFILIYFLVSTIIVIQYRFTSNSLLDLISFVKCINNIQGSVNIGIFGFMTELNIANKIEIEYYNNVNRSELVRSRTEKNLNIVLDELQILKLTLNNKQYLDLFDKINTIWKKYNNFTTAGKISFSNIPVIIAIQRMVSNSLSLTYLINSKLISTAYQKSYYGVTSNISFLDRVIFDVTVNLQANLTISATTARLYALDYTKALVKSNLSALFIETLILLGVIFLYIVIIILIIKRFDKIKKGILTLFMIIPPDKVAQTIQEIGTFIDRLHNLKVTLNEKDKTLTQNKKKVHFIQNNGSPQKDDNTKIEGSISDLINSIFENKIENLESQNDEEDVGKNQEEEFFLRNRSKQVESLKTNSCLFFISIFVLVVLLGIITIYNLAINIYWGSQVPSNIDNYIKVNNLTISYSILTIFYRAHVNSFHRIFRGNDRDPFVRHMEWTMTSLFDLQVLEKSNDIFYKPYIDRVNLQNDQNFCNIAKENGWIDTSIQFCKESNFGIFNFGFDYAINYFILTMQKDFTQFVNNNHDLTFSSTVLNSTYYIDLIDGYFGIVTNVFKSNELLAGNILSNSINDFFLSGIIFYILSVSILFISIIIIYFLVHRKIKSEMKKLKCLLSLLPSKVMYGEFIDNINKCLTMIE